MPGPLFRQVSRLEWPEGDNHPIAVLRLEPTALHEPYGIEFSREADDLDQLDLAVLEIDHRRYVLVRYLGHPSPGTEVVGTSRRLLRGPCAPSFER